MIIKKITFKVNLQENPLYIFCESYGGKMAAATALAISKVS